MTDAQTATIGASTFVKGRVEGTDDLVIQGRVEGSVKLPENSVVIASGSRVKADVTARSIEVKGRVEGTLTASSEITVRSGGRVDGDILAPRVTLENGAHFCGNVDMEQLHSKTASSGG